MSVKKEVGIGVKMEEVEDSFIKIKKKYNRKYTNPKVNPYRFIEGTVNDYEDED